MREGENRKEGNVQAAVHRQKAAHEQKPWECWNQLMTGTPYLQGAHGGGKKINPKHMFLVVLEKTRPP